MAGWLYPFQRFEMRFRSWTQNRRVDADTAGLSLQSPRMAETRTAVQSTTPGALFVAERYFRAQATTPAPIYSPDCSRLPIDAMVNKSRAARSRGPENLTADADQGEGVSNRPGFRLTIKSRAALAAQPRRGRCVFAICIHSPMVLRRPAAPRPLSFLMELFSMTSG
jgi:hypothetical protein